MLSQSVWKRPEASVLDESLRPPSPEFRDWLVGTGGRRNEHYQPLIDAVVDGKVDLVPQTGFRAAWEGEAPAVCRGCRGGTR